MALTDYLERTGRGIVDHANASLEIIPELTSELPYLYLRTLMISVFKAAIGGGGILEVKTIDNGTVIWSINVDSTKDLSFPWGSEGTKVSDVKYDGLYAVVSGADTQASVSVGMVVHNDME